MQIRFLGQGLGSGHDQAIGNELQRAIGDTRFSSLEAYVAFLSISAAEYLTQQVRSRAGFQANLYVGVDQKGTSKEALEELLSGPINTKIFFTTSSPTYHPKVYIFKGQSDVRVIVGSSNLTAMGLFANVEASVCVDYSMGDTDGEAFLTQINDFFSPIVSATANVQPLTQPNIDLLHAAGIVPTEAQRAAAQGEGKGASRGSTGTASPLQALFPPRASGPIPIARGRGRGSSAPNARGAGAAAPTSGRATTTQNQSSSRRSSRLRTFWIEAGSLTGGSRNQLDLSRVSANRRLNGSLAFFGMSGANTRSSKRIRIRYKGLDYTDNQIIFPLTKSGRSNDTWRLQMNGTSANGQQLTIHCQADFIGRILIFSELGQDHYEIKAVNTRRHLARLKRISTVWDQNRGARGRHFGQI
jgi:HKD family nuclease